jgi:SAM-dependent methyltransferase
VIELAQIGAWLRDAGLNPRALAAWTGTSRLAALPPRLDARPVEEPLLATPAGALLALMVAGAEVAPDRLRVARGSAVELVDALLAHGVVERTGAALRARLAILPLAGSLLVCDRLDAPVERDLVCWPDDSSHHLASAIPPGERADWLDVGCGSGFAPLARPALAGQITGVDINQRAVRYAKLGAALSRLSHVTAAAGDAGDRHAPAALVTCNAPMPARPAPAHHAAALPEVWRFADPGLFARLWPALAAAVRPGGMIVAHAACEALVPALRAAPGERVIVTYTPDGVLGFAVAWWRPDAPERWVSTRRALTPERPHLDARDRHDALAAAESS